MMYLSPSSRRAWVEISMARACRSPPSVALLAEGVGRNRPFLKIYSFVACVALLTEGVGRNIKTGGQCIHLQASPSSRRAWVEMM